MDCDFVTISISDTRFSGKVRLGLFSKEFVLAGGVVRKAGLNNVTLHNCIVEDNVFIENVQNYIDNYYIAEGYPAAEMKHGPIALIDSEMPIVVIATHNEMYQKVLSNIQELKARGGRVIAIVTEGDTQMTSIADEIIEIPETMECFEPLLTTIPLQLMSYHIAVCKGQDVDQPRNLAKSVTVE